jgi:hypothetical protein
MEYYVTTAWKEARRGEKKRRIKQQAGTIAIRQRIGFETPF